MKNMNCDEITSKQALLDHNLIEERAETKGMTRRTFFKTSALVGGCAALASQVDALAGLFASGVMAAGNEKIIETAKRNMTYSIIGVIVALAGFVIIQAIDTALRATSTVF